MEALVRIDLEELRDEITDKIAAQFLHQGKVDPTGLAEQLLDHTICERVLATIHLTEGQEANTRLSLSLMKGLKILAMFLTCGRPLGVVEAAEMAGLSASTTHRYIATLIAAGYLRQNPTSRKYEVISAPATSLSA